MDNKNKLDMMIFSLPTTDKQLEAPQEDEDSDEDEETGRSEFLQFF